MRLTVGTTLVLGLLAVGCGTDPVERAVTQGQILQDVLCECPGAVGAASEAECRMRIAMYSLTETEKTCLRRVYDAHTAELAPVFDCQYAASLQFESCLRDVLMTCPPDAAARDNCVARYGAANEACPRASEQATAELNACFASRT